MGCPVTELIIPPSTPSYSLLFLRLLSQFCCRYNPIKTIKTNFLGTMNMLGLAKRTRARFLLTSTSEVYGDPIEHPQTEGYWGNVNCIGERSCYDEGG